MWRLWPTYSSGSCKRDRSTADRPSYVAGRELGGLGRGAGEAIRPLPLWELVQWFGQLSPAQFNLALGAEGPDYILEDEKHLTEEGQKAYVPIIYTPKDALI